MERLRCEFAENEYGTYCLPKSSLHRPAAQHALNGGVWEPDTLKYMRENGADGIIFHAGTYFGDFLPALSVAKKVIAFEPSLENFRCAQITMMMNDLTNVHLYHKGLGASHAKLHVQTHDHEKTALGGTARIVGEGNDFTEEVEITTIDYMTDVCGAWTNLKIIQLDIEGYEQKALEGAVRNIRMHKPILILELWNDNVLQTDFFQETIFEEFGYKEERRLHDNIVLRAD